MPPAGGMKTEERLGGSSNRKEPPNGCGLARRPEGSRAMKRETRSELIEVFRDGWPIFLTNFLVGALLGFVLTRLR